MKFVRRNNYKPLCYDKLSVYLHKSSSAFNKIVGFLVGMEMTYSAHMWVKICNRKSKTIHYQVINGICFCFPPELSFSQKRSPNSIKILLLELANAAR